MAVPDPYMSNQDNDIRRKQIKRAIQGLQDAQFPEEMAYYLRQLQNLRLGQEEEAVVNRILSKKRSRT